LGTKQEPQVLVLLRPTALAESICMALSRKGEIKQRDYERNKSRVGLHYLIVSFFFGNKKSGLIANESNSNMSPSEL